MFIHFLSVIKSCTSYTAFTYFPAHHVNLLIHGSLHTQWEAIQGDVAKWKNHETEQKIEMYKNVIQIRI